MTLVDIQFSSITLFLECCQLLAPEDEPNE